MVVFQFKRRITTTSKLKPQHCKRRSSTVKFQNIHHMFGPVWPTFVAKIPTNLNLISFLITNQIKTYRLVTIHWPIHPFPNIFPHSFNRITRDNTDKTSKQIEIREVHTCSPSHIPIFKGCCFCVGEEGLNFFGISRRSGRCDRGETWPLWSLNRWLMMQTNWI